MFEFLKYLGIFLASFTEGPTAGVSVGFLSRLGYMNIYLGYLTHVFGDLSADFLYYSLGYFGGIKLLPKLAKFFGFTLKEIEKAKIFFQSNRKKVIVFGKLSHFVGLPILITAGIAQYPWWKFLILDFFATAIKSAFLVAVGYYFGEVWKRYSNVFLDTTIALFMLIFIPIAYFLFKRRKQRKKK